MAYYLTPRGLMFRILVPKFRTSYSEYLLELSKYHLHVLNSIVPDFFQIDYTG